MFASISTNEYGVVVAPSDLDMHDISNLTTDALESCFSVVGTSWNDFAETISNGSFERLTKQRCVDTYGGTPFLSGRGTVVVLSDLNNTADEDTSILLGGFGQIPQDPYSEYSPHQWLCANLSSCDKATLDNTIDSVQVNGYPFRSLTWAFDLVTSHGSSAVTFVVGKHGNFSVDTCSNEAISDFTCSDADKLVDWFRLTNKHPASEQLHPGQYHIQQYYRSSHPKR